MRACSQPWVSAPVASRHLGQRDALACRTPALTAPPAGPVRCRKLQLSPVRAAIAEPPPSVSPDFSAVPRPDKNGRYGKYGGKYVPETLISALEELEAKYAEVKADPVFQARATAGRPPDSIAAGSQPPGPPPGGRDVDQDLCGALPAVPPGA